MSETTSRNALAARFAAKVDDGCDLSAVVVFRPDRRRKAAEAMAAESGRDVDDLRAMIPGDPRTARDLLQHLHGSIRHTVWRDDPADPVPLVERSEWAGFIYGPRIATTENQSRDFAAFGGLAREAAMLIPRPAPGDDPLSSWLIHLVARSEPLEPEAGRRVGEFVLINGRPWLPGWRPATPDDCESGWWVARIPNVFRLSQRALAEGCDHEAAPPGWKEQDRSPAGRAETADRVLATLLASPLGESRPQHAPDFSWVRCVLGTFTFSANQRPVVKALWQDWQIRGLGLGQSYLLGLAGGDTADLRSLFKDHAAWKTLIVKGDRNDTFRLALDPPAA